MKPLSVLIAPDSFKGSLSAARVAAALAEGWLSVRPADSVTTIPLADGGEGTLAAIEAAQPLSVRRHAGLVSGPDGRPVRGEWLELPGQVAVIELAQMSGLPLMSKLDALGATTFGLGQVIAHALDTGMQQLIIGLGGSASTDGGAGALAALGLRQGGRQHSDFQHSGRQHSDFQHSGGTPLSSGGAGLLALTSLDRSGLRPAPAGGVVLLTDVSAPLLGPAGAAAVFAPQKGANAAQVATLELALANFAHLMTASTGDASTHDRSTVNSSAATPGAGAAGGTAFGFAAAWGAQIVAGADYITRLSGAADAVLTADIVLTGEGRFDETSVVGKLVGAVIHSASTAPHSGQIGVIAGQISATPRSADGEVLWSVSLVQLAGSTSEALAEPERLLRAAGAQAARELPHEICRPVDLDTR